MSLSYCPTCKKFPLYVSPETLNEFIDVIKKSGYEVKRIVK